MHVLKITTVGGSAGIILDEEVMAHLGIRKGDTLCLTEAADGGYRLTRYQPDFARQMVLAEDVMDDDRDVLGALCGDRTRHVVALGPGGRRIRDSQSATRRAWWHSSHIARGALSEGDLAAWFGNG